MSQFALPLDWPAPETADNFIVTSANASAVAQLERPGSWPVRAALLIGPRKSGRSLLGRIFAAKSGAMLIDDAELHGETALFHRWNSAQEERHPLLIIAQAAPPLWRVTLPDLASRLKATPVFEIGMPDDELILRLLEKLLAQRGLIVPPEAITYVAGRIERSYVAILRAVDALDSAALSQRKGVTVPLARSILGGDSRNDHPESWG